MRFPLPRWNRGFRLRVSAGVPVLAVLAAWLAVTGVPRAIAAEADADASGTGAQAARAETGGPGSGKGAAGVEVLHVKGRGAAAIEADVPSSLTLFDAATIEALGAQDISDLSRVTPNVNIVQPGSTQAIFFVRGIGLSDFSSNAAGAVAVFQDDVAINAAPIQTGQLFDI